MNNWLKNLLVTGFLFGFLALIPAGCGEFCNDSCGCSPVFPPQNIRIKSFEMLTFSEGQQITPTNQQPFNRVVKSFRIKDFDLISYSQKEVENHWSFGTAIACSPIPPTSEKKLIEIQIINLSEVKFEDGTVLGTGQDISAYFGINNFFQEGLVPIPEFLKGGRSLPLEELNKLGFTKDPGIPVNMLLNFSFLLDGGTELRITNETLSIGPKN
jgi:hypothetical protein